MKYSYADSEVIADHINRHGKFLDNQFKDDPIFVKTATQIHETIHYKFPRLVGVTMFFVLVSIGVFLLGTINGNNALMSASLLVPIMPFLIYNNDNTSTRLNEWIRALQNVTRYSTFYWKRVIDDGIETGKVSPTSYHRDIGTVLQVTFQSISFLGDQSLLGRIKANTMRLIMGYPFFILFILATTGFLVWWNFGTISWPMFTLMFAAALFVNVYLYIMIVGKVYMGIIYLFIPCENWYFSNMVELNKQEQQDWDHHGG